MNLKSDTADLTNDQRFYLERTDPAKSVFIFPFDKSAKQAGMALVEKIKLNTELDDVYLIGSLMFEISGSNDIDVMCFCEKGDLAKMKGKLSELFQGANFFDRGKYLEWNDVTIKNFLATVYLNDENDDKAWDHVKFTQILIADPKLILKYEKVKNAGVKIGSEISYKNYMERKYRFINQVLMG